MPELPEVETLCKQLREKIIGQKILAENTYDTKINGKNDISRKEIVDVKRSAKEINILLHDGSCLSIHLRMTGRIIWQKEKEIKKHTRWRMELENGNIDLVDQRRFATIKYKSEYPSQACQDLMEKFDQEEFLKKQAKRSVAVKILLMDPQAISGIGNIYACEILHQAGISPLRVSKTIENKQWRKIFSCARKILKKAIAKRGTSISDWCDLYGKKGENQKELKIYGREGKDCFICGSEIKRIKQAGRSTFYCPNCQK